MGVRYSNPPVAEGINAPESKPLIGFLKYSLLGIITITILMGGFYILGRLLAPNIPFSWEQKIPLSSLLPEHRTPLEKQKAASLQRLVDSLAAHMNMPSDIRCIVHIWSRPGVKKE